MPNPSPAADLAEPWLRGAAANPAAPSGVLLRLLDPAGRAAWQTLCRERDLPVDVIDAVIGHPVRAVRSAFARNPRADPAQRGRLAGDPSALVRAALAGGPRPRPRTVRPLPDDVLAALLTSQGCGHDGMLTAPEIAQELTASGQIPQSFRRAMPEHGNPALREIGTGLWLSLSTARRTALLSDPVPEVREAARASARKSDPAAMEAALPERDCHSRAIMLTNFAVSAAVVDACLAGRRNLWALASNPHTPFDAVGRLARDPDPEVRERVAARADLDAALLAELAGDPDETVRTRARAHPLPRTWAQRDAVDKVTGRHSGDCACTIGELFTEPDTSWYQACAVSGHPVMRRVAASHPGLPVELVERLAGDPDPAVRHQLASHHPLAPPGLVLDTFLARPGQRPHLLTLSRLPRTGLRRLLGHGDPEVRALAAGDSTLERAPVELLGDPDERVRRAAAANPLVDRDALRALLRDPATAEGAAANPNLSAPCLHGLLDLAGLPGGG